jgi:hypothetical protein
MLYTKEVLVDKSKIKEINYPIIIDMYVNNFSIKKILRIQMLR